MIVLPHLDTCSTINMHGFIVASVFKVIWHVMFNCSLALIATEVKHILDATEFQQQKKPTQRARAGMTLLNTKLIYLNQLFIYILYVHSLWGVD